MKYMRAQGIHGVTWSRVSVDFSSSLSGCMLCACLKYPRAASLLPCVQSTSPRCGNFHILANLECFFEQSDGLCRVAHAEQDPAQANP